MRPVGTLPRAGLASKLSNVAVAGVLRDFVVEPVAGMAPLVCGFGFWHFTL